MGQLGGYDRRGINFVPRLSGMCKVRTCGGLIGPQVGANTLVAALYPDYCFLINLTGKPRIGGCGKMCVGGAKATL